MFYFVKGTELCWKCRPYFLKGKVYDSVNRRWRDYVLEEAQKKRSGYLKQYRLNKRYEEQAQHEEKICITKEEKKEILKILSTWNVRQLRKLLTK